MTTSMNLIKFVRRLNRHPRSILNFFDDAGGFVFNSKYILVKVDGFAASRALYPWCRMSDLGFRAITAAISDVIAKGCRPIVYAISIGVTNNHLIDDIMQGIEEGVRLYGGYVENFDTNFGNDVWVDVFVLAECRVYPVPRSVEADAELILVDRIGSTAIAYIEHYIYGEKPEDESVVERVCRPRAPLSVVDVIEKYRSSIIGSIDISDTFAETLYDLVLASNGKYGIYLDFDPSMIADSNLINYVYEKKRLDVLTGIFISNEEYIPILVVRKQYVEDILNELRDKGFNPYVLGYVTCTTNQVVWRGIKVKKIVWNYAKGRISILNSL
ncbi:MAG TPA: hypothetical protein EYH02_03870 [Ignisphaera aggregans]|uniref:PurM-like N-terminal domain-containing protein n=1 Tax=Ignisphaera aggregans TaxID=334771 RepID=A0A832YZ51_9CREN|nr:hypothetical protein [Ignisphaera aggregans]